MRYPYCVVFRVLADATVVVHLAFVVFVLLGGLLVLRWPRVAWAHLPAAAWGAWVEFAGSVCPLTPVENWLREQGDRVVYGSSFIEHYLLPILYPASLSRELQWALGGIVVLVNFAVYLVVLGRGRLPTLPGDAVRQAAPMESWPILPEAPLEAAGPDSEAFLRIGCGSFRSAARHLHELPYGRNSERSDYRLVLSEGRGTCSTKHALLAAVALEQRLPVSLTIGIYDMSEANTPGVGRVLSAHGLDSIPEAHCYLCYAGRRVDITRSGIAAQAPITRFHAEWSIDPAQIGAHKLALHQQYLRSWLCQRRDVRFSFEELWRIREACILALGVT